MIEEIMLESEMSPVGSVRSAAEPVLLAAKFEVLTPVVFAGGGGVVAAEPPLAVIEAVIADSAGGRSDQSVLFIG